MIHLTNILKALVLHLLLCISSYALEYFEIYPSPWIPAAISLALYVLCGYFLLKPVKRFPPLPCLALLLFVLGGLVFALSAENHSDQYKFAYFNPTTALGFLVMDLLPQAGDALEAALYWIGFWLPFVLPSLFLYLGMLLRRQRIRKSAQSAMQEGAQIPA